MRLQSGWVQDLSMGFIKLSQNAGAYKGNCFLISIFANYFKQISKSDTASR